MKKVLPWALCALILLPGLASSLPKAREMDETALIRTLGVDAGAQARFLVTASSGRRARGISGESEPPLILSAEGDSVSGGCLAVRKTGPSQIFYGHLGQLLLGEELVRRDVWEVLNYICGSRELGLGTQLWLVLDGTAREAMDADEENGTERRLTALQADGRMGYAGMTRTVGETVTSLLEDGSAFLPALRLENGVLMENGYGILKDGRLAAVLTGEKARGLELAMGHPGGELLELEEAVVRVERARLGAKTIEKQGRTAGIRLSLRLNACVEEVRGGVDRETLSEKIEALERQKVTDAVQTMQNHGTDCLALGRRAALSGPESVDPEQWQADFRRLPVETVCTLTLTGGGREEIKHAGR